MEEVFYVYIIYSESRDVYYKGMTQNLENRLQEHNENISRYTAGRGPWKYVHIQKYLTKREALIEESRLKKFNRRSLMRLIHGKE